MRLLLTRPADEAERLGEQLRAQGHQVLVEPMLTIQHRAGPPLDLDGVQALLLTSANGVRALVRHTGRRDLPVLTVGDTTACAALAAGFTDVRSADGDVHDLKALVLAHLSPAGGRLLHVGGSHVAGDLAGELGAAGFTVDRAVLYEAQAATALSLPARTALAEGRLDGVLVYSPRTAAILAKLVQTAGLASACRTIDVFCLSRAVAEAAAGLPWRRSLIAAAPRQDALLRLLPSGEKSA